MARGGTIRFQTDEDFNGRVIAGLRRRQPDIDLLTAAQAGLIGQGDPEVLAHAAKEGRILLIWEVSEPADWVDQLHRLPL